MIAKENFLKCSSLLLILFIFIFIPSLMDNMLPPEKPITKIGPFPVPPINKLESRVKAKAFQEAVLVKTEGKNSDTQTSVLQSAIQEKHPLFPLPDRLKPQVDFWKKIFTEYTADQKVIHDSRYVSVVYEVVDTSNPQISGQIVLETAREKYKRLLENFPWDAPQNMTEEELRIYKQFQKIPESPLFKKKDAKDRIRIQAGHADTFKAGIVRSGRYLDAMKQIFKKHKIPQELVYLTLIESSFDPHIESYLGALGIWQFMPRTGRHYNLKIGDLVDERRDPLLSSVAAARFLKDNYRELKSWPLAITAYNHGAGGMKRAIKQLKSRKIEDIVTRYDGRRFEFASRNFYVEFIAALDAASQYTKYFGPLELEAPIELTRIKLPHFIVAKTLEKYFQIPTAKLQDLNPALDPSVFDSKKMIPKGYYLNIPKRQKERLLARYEAIPDTLKFKYIPTRKRYRVKRGQTLSEIAAAHNASVKEFLRLNNIRNPQKIREGQLLTIPGEYAPLKKHFMESYQEKSSSSSKAINRRHRIRRGQTLITIAKHYNTSVKAIIELNEIKNPKKIKYGRLLKIPEG